MPCVPSTSCWSLCRQVARTHLALVVRLYAALRLVQCPRVLRAARSVVGHLCASAPRPLLHAVVARPLPSAFSAPLPSGQREHIAEQFAWQRSLFAPSNCSGPLALSCPLSARPPSSSRVPLPRSLVPWLSVSLSSSSLYPPGIHFAEQHARQPSRSPCTLPPPGALVPSAPHPAALYSRPTSPSPPCPCPSLYLLFVPTLVSLLASRTHDASTPPAPPFLPCPFPSLLYAEHFAGHCVGMSHACRGHAPGPRCVTLRGADRFAATRRGAPPCPEPPRSAGGSLGGGAPLCFRPTLAPSCRRGTPPALPCLLCPSALRPARAQCGAIRVAALPLRPLSLPWPLGPVLPPVCSPSLVHSCPPSQVPWSLALGVSVPVLPLPSRHTLRGTIREAPLPFPLHLAAPWRPGSFRTGPRPAALYFRPTSPSLPCPFPSLHSAEHYAGHFVGMPHACRRHTPGPSLPAPPRPLSTLCRTLCRTLCWQTARMSQAHTWPLLAASSGGLAQRCDRPPLPQPPQEPPPRASTPNAAGGAALIGPGCPPARVSLYPPRRLVAGGDPSQISARHRKKIDIYIYIVYIYIYIYIHTYIYIYIYIYIKAFWDFPWPKTRHHGLKTGQKHVFEHPKWSGNNFGKNDFFRPGDPGGPTVGPRRARAGLPSDCTK